MKEFDKIQTIKGKKFLFKVEASKDYRDYQKYEDLRNEIWSEPNDTLPGARNMMCENFLYDGSSLFIAVYREERSGVFKQDREHLVGFSYGFVGIKDKKIAFREPDNLQFYSQYTGVKPDFQHLGLGVLIKQFQQEKLMALFGIFTVTCTYDPLTGINAYRNIHRFGMDVVGYREAYYGDFGGLLNRVDIPCDRFLVSWDLKKDIQRPEYDLERLINSGTVALEAAIEEVKGKSGALKLEVVKDLNLDLNHEFLLVEIPVDFYLMLQETDVAENKVRSIPLEWRMKTRQAFKTLFNRNYKIIDFRLIKKDQSKRDFYILKR
jgi:predicted GNAT superfamily acetyltransferase